MNHKEEQSTGTPPTAMASTLYSVVAYRFGQLNGHQYTVGVLADEDEAIDLANEEADDHGGKYGLAVYAWPQGRAESQLGPNLAHYVPSSYGEEKPRHNHRLDMFHAIGHRCMDAVIRRRLIVSENSPMVTPEDVAKAKAKFAPGAEIVGLAVGIDIEPTDWMIDVVREQMVSTLYMQRSQAWFEEQRAKRAAEPEPSPSVAQEGERPSPEGMQWVDGRLLMTPEYQRHSQVLWAECEAHVDRELGEANMAALRDGFARRKGCSSA